MGEGVNLLIINVRNPSIKLDFPTFKLILENPIFKVWNFEVENYNFYVGIFKIIFLKVAVIIFYSYVLFVLCFVNKHICCLFLSDFFVYEMRSCLKMFFGRRMVTIWVQFENFIHFISYLISVFNYFKHVKWLIQHWLSVTEWRA